MKSALIVSEAVEAKALTLANALKIAVVTDDGSKEMRLRNSSTVQTLMRAESYWMAADIWGAIVQSSLNLPLDFVFSGSVAPAPYGWIWLEKPWHIPGSTRESEPEAVEIGVLDVCGISWGVGTSPAGEEVLGVESFHRSRESGIVPLYSTFTKPPRTIAQEEERRRAELIAKNRGEDDVALHALVRSVLAMFLWVKQTICVARHAKLERHVAKRVSRQQMEKTLSVIVLRRSEGAADNRNNTSSEPVEWSCRWLVSGHWRRQYHPSTGEREPIFILPYVKGPDDKPFKESTSRIFAVTR